MKTINTHARVKGCNNEGEGLTKLNHKNRDRPMNIDELPFSADKVINLDEFTQAAKEAQGLEVANIIDNTEERLTIWVDKNVGGGYKLDFRRQGDSEIDIYTTDPYGSGLVQAHSGKSEEAAWWEYDFILETIDVPLKIFGDEDPQSLSQGQTDAEVDSDAFSDKEIRGIISTLTEEDVVGKPFIQIDASGVSTRGPSDIPQWAVDEAEGKSAPFTVDGYTYVAFDGRGYTAVVRR